MFRRSVNKNQSAKRFRSNVRRTKGANVMAVQRGGIRL